MKSSAAKSGRSKMICLKFFEKPIQIRAQQNHRSLPLGLKPMDTFRPSRNEFGCWSRFVPTQARTICQALGASAAHSTKWPSSRPCRISSEFIRCFEPAFFRTIHGSPAERTLWPASLFFRDATFQALLQVNAKPNFKSGLKTWPGSPLTSPMSPLSECIWLDSALKSMRSTR